MMKQDHNSSSTASVADDDFDIFLRGQLQQAQPYLMDDNFTAQVMVQLPAAKKLSMWQERLIILVPLLIISLLVFSQFSVLDVLVKLWTLLVAADISSLLNIGLVISMAAVSGASYWFLKQLKLM